MNNLFETRVEPAKLHYFLESKCQEKKDTFSYNYANDTNLMNLRFCIYLLSEELETLINNLDESHGLNYINSMDAKLEKRNEIVNHLLREKSVTMKLFSKMLSVFQNCYAEVLDMINMMDMAPDFKEKGRFSAKLKGLVSDLTLIDQFRSYSKTYMTERDFQNLISSQKDAKDPLKREQYLEIAETYTLLEKLDKNAQIMEDYKMLSSDMAIKEENYNRLLKKYDQLLKDFMELTSNAGTAGSMNTLKKEDYDMIFSKYKEVKEKEEAEKKLREPVGKKSGKKSRRKLKSKSKGTNSKGRSSAGGSPSPFKYEDRSTSNNKVRKPKSSKDTSRKRIVGFEGEIIDNRKKIRDESPFTQNQPRKKVVENTKHDTSDTHISFDFSKGSINPNFGQPSNLDVDISHISRQGDNKPQQNNLKAPSNNDRPPPRDLDNRTKPETSNQDHGRASQSNSRRPSNNGSSISENRPQGRADHPAEREGQGSKGWDAGKPRDAEPYTAPQPINPRRPSAVDAGLTNPAAIPPPPPIKSVLTTSSVVTTPPPPPPIRKEEPKSSNSGIGNSFGPPPPPPPPPARSGSGVMTSSTPPPPPSFNIPPPPPIMNHSGSNSSIPPPPPLNNKSETFIKTPSDNTFLNDKSGGKSGGEKAGDSYFDQSIA